MSYNTKTRHGAMGDAEARDGHQGSGEGFNSTAPDAASTYVVHLLFPCDEGDHFLAEIVTDSVARLPRVTIPLHGEEYLKIDVLERKVEELCPYPVCLVRRPLGGVFKEDDIENPGQKVIHDTWVVHAAGELPLMKAPLQWVPHDGLFWYRWLNSIPTLADSHVRENIIDAFEIINSGVEILAKPWETLGFYKRLVGLTQEGLGQVGMVMDGRARIVENGEDARVYKCTVRVGSDGRRDFGTDGSEVVFMKATSPLVREVERTVAVASVFRNIVPEILGFDAQWGILVQRDVGSLKDEGFDQEGLIGTVLYMQRVSMNHIEHLKAKGLRVMGAEWVASNVESILNHVIFEDYFRWSEDALACCDEERETLQGLRSKVREIQEICRQIMKLGLPNTIVHGDYYKHNIGRSITGREGKLYRVFDWATAYIGNPLTDLIGIFGPVFRGTGGKGWDAGMHQVCGQWKQLARFTHGEIRKAMDGLWLLRHLIRLHELEEQHDPYKATTMDDHEDLSGHETRVFRDLKDHFEFLGRTNKRIEAMNQSDHQYR